MIYGEQTQGRPNRRWIDDILVVRNNSDGQGAVTLAADKTVEELARG